MVVKTKIDVLKRLIAEAVSKELKELAEPEAPKDAPFGQYLFAPIRDDAPDEPNTDIEDKFKMALISHYEEFSGDLSEMWPALWDMKQKNQYKKFLEPPNKPVYRYISGVSLLTASKILNVPIDKITNSPNKIKHIKKVGVLKPISNVGIQSWTIDPTLEELEEFVYPSHGKVTMLVVADPHSSGQFLVNPINLAKDTGNKISSYIENELEVISKGPAKIIEAAYFYFLKTTVFVLSREEIKQLLKKYDILNVPKNYIVPKETIQKIMTDIKKIAIKKNLYKDFFNIKTALKLTNDISRENLEDNLEHLYVVEHGPDREDLLSALNL